MFPIGETGILTISIFEASVVKDHMNFVKFLIIIRKKAKNKSTGALWHQENKFENEPNKTYIEISWSNEEIKSVVKAIIACKICFDSFSLRDFL